MLQHLPSFGSYLKQREEIIADEKKRITIEDVEAKMMTGRTVNSPQREVPQIKDVIGRSLPHIGTYNQLSNKEQVVALIDEVTNI